MKLADVCQINPPKLEIKSLDPEMSVSFVPMADLNENEAGFTVSEERKLKDVGANYAYFTNDDVLLAKVTPCFENGKAGIANNLKNDVGFGSSEYYILRSNQSKLLPEYLYLNIANDKMKKLGKPAMTGTGGLQRVPRNFIESYNIPLPLLKLQKEIIAEFAEEQKISEANKTLINLYTQKIQTKLAEVWSGNTNEVYHHKLYRK